MDPNPQQPPMNIATHHALQMQAMKTMAETQKLMADTQKDLKECQQKLVTLTERSLDMQMAQQRSLEVINHNSTIISTRMDDMVQKLKDISSSFASTLNNITSKQSDTINKTIQYIVIITLSIAGGTGLGYLIKLMGL